MRGAAELPHELPLQPTPAGRDVAKNVLDRARVAGVFANVADRIGDVRVAALLRAIGARNDVTLGSFGWQLVETPDGLSTAKLWSPLVAN